MNRRLIDKFSFSVETLQKQGMIINSNKRRTDFNTEINYTMIDLLSKHYRKFNLEQPMAEFRKVTMPAKRLRSIDDHITNMIKQHEVAAVINGREEFKDIDIVFDHYQVSAMKRRVASNVAPVYVDIPGYDEQSIRCVLQKYLRTHTGEVLFKLFLNRYIVGRENLIFLPLQLERNFNNPYLLRGSGFESKIEGVWVNCYNDSYPSVLKVDITNVTPNRPYKIGDLQNSMPQGMLLHDRYQKIMHRNLFTVTEDEEKKFLKQLESQRSMQEGQQISREDEFLLGESKFQSTQIQVKEKKAPKKKEYSLKKQVQKANEELKKEVAQADAQKAAEANKQK